MRFFRRRGPSALERLRDAAWTCAYCEIEHRGMFDIGAFAPDHWGEVDAREPNSALRLEGDFLSEDFCVIGGEHFLVRGVFEIPVHGMAEKFGFGIWATLSREHFERYVDCFDEGGYAGEGPWFGWFSNRQSGFVDALNQACWVHPQLDRQRPTVALDDPEHELSLARSTASHPSGCWKSMLPVGTVRSNPGREPCAVASARPNAALR